MSANGALQIALTINVNPYPEIQKLESNTQDRIRNQRSKPKVIIKPRLLSQFVWLLWAVGLETSWEPH